jgi:hypothetical protein
VPGANSAALLGRLRGLSQAPLSGAGVACLAAVAGADVEGARQQHDLEARDRALQVCGTARGTGSPGSRLGFPVLGVMQRRAGRVCGTAQALPAQEESSRRM